MDMDLFDELSHLVEELNDRVGMLESKLKLNDENDFITYRNLKEETKLLKMRIIKLEQCCNAKSASTDKIEEEPRKT